MAKLTVEYTEEDLKNLILNDIYSRFSTDTNLTIHFEVKTSMNYKADWEYGKFRCTVTNDF